MRIDASIDLFEQEKSLQGLANGSITEYGYQLGVWCRWLASQDIHNTEDIELADIMRYLSYRHKHTNQSSLCHQRTILRSWIDWLYQAGHTSVDPRVMPKVAKPKDDQIRRVRLSEDQTTRLFNAMKKRYRENRHCPRRGYRYLQDLVLAALLFGAGLRISEALVARISELDTANRELFIPHAKNHTPAYVAVSGFAIGILRLYLKVRSGIKTKSDVILISQEGHPYKSETLSRRLQRIANEAGIEFTSHAGRRYCITELAAIDVFMAQQQARHKHLSTTRIYVPTDRDKLRQTMKHYDPLRFIRREAC